MTKYFSLCTSKLSPGQNKTPGYKQPIRDKTQNGIYNIVNTEANQSNIYFILFRCQKDSTFQLNKYSTKQFQFTVKAFDFLKRNNGIYIHCLSMVCYTKSNDTSCYFGCGDKHGSFRNNKRQKRNLQNTDSPSFEENGYTVTSGYIRYHNETIGTIKNQIQQGRICLFEFLASSFILYTFIPRGILPRNLI